MESVQQIGDQFLSVMLLESLELLRKLTDRSLQGKWLHYTLVSEPHPFYKVSELFRDNSFRPKCVFPVDFTKVLVGEKVFS
jgi:poly-D-alanine transfer protein DltD